MPGVADDEDSSTRVRSDASSTTSRSDDYDETRDCAPPTRCLAASSIRAQAAPLRRSAGPPVTDMSLAAENPGKSRLSAET